MVQILIKYWALQDLGMKMIHIMDRGKKIQISVKPPATTGRNYIVWSVHDAELYHAATLR